MTEIECLLVTRRLKKNLPIVVPGWEDSTLEIFLLDIVKLEKFLRGVMKSGVEYMMYLYDQYKELSKDGEGLGFSKSEEVFQEIFLSV